METKKFENKKVGSSIEPLVQNHIRARVVGFLTYRRLWLLSACAYNGKW